MLKSKFKFLKKINTIEGVFVHFFTNLGKIRNHGFEVAFSVVPVRLRDFTWTVNVNWTKLVKK